MEGEGTGKGCQALATARLGTGYEDYHNRMRKETNLRGPWNYKLASALGNMGGFRA